MSVPFSSQQFEDPDKPIKGMPVRKVRVDRLDATQYTWDPAKVASMAASESPRGGKLPIVAKNPDGRLSVLDGHHGAAAAMMKGERYMKVRISK